MRILWIKTELLHPVDKGGKIRTYHMLKELKREHHVTYLTLDDPEATAPSARDLALEYCNELVCVPHRQRAKFSATFYLDLTFNLLSKLPYAIAKYESAAMRRRINELTLEKTFDVLVCDFLTPSVNVPERSPFASVLFQHNVEAMIWKRHYETQANPLKKAYLYWQWRKIRAFESAACRRFDYVAAVSAEDSEVMQREYNAKAVADVPTGVDTNYFRACNGVHREPYNLVFTGSMDWLPNEDAIRHFTKHIMPLIKQTVPGVTLTVVGRNPYPSLLELTKRDPSVIVTGRVEDTRPYMDRAAAYVVPMRVGGGTRLKIYEAMAMEMPVISTTVGAEGLPLRDGEHLLIADTPGAFASAVIRVMTDESMARALGTRASQAVREHFGWDRAAAAFSGICRSAVERFEAKPRTEDNRENRRR